MTYLMLLVYLHYYTNQNCLHCILVILVSHAVFPCYYCTCTQLATVNGAWIDKLARLTVSALSSNHNTWFIQQIKSTYMYMCEIAAEYFGTSAVIPCHESYSCLSIYIPYIYCIHACKTYFCCSWDVLYTCACIRLTLVHVVSRTCIEADNTMTRIHACTIDCCAVTTF